MERSRKKKRIEFNQKNILEAANELFLSKGVEQTTVDEIAKHAGCSKSTVYVYFTSKDDIFYHLVHEAMQSLFVKLTEFAEANLSFTNFFMAACWHMVDVKRSLPVYFFGLASNIPVSKEAMNSYPILHKIYVTGEEVVSLLCKKIQENLSATTVVDEKTIVTAVLALWYALCGIIEQSYIKEEYVTLATGKNREDFLAYSFR